MIEHPVTFGKFLGGWVPALLLSASVEAPAERAAVILQLGGIDIPVVTCALGLLGVIASRFLALPQEKSLGTPRFLTVSLLMIVLVQVWIVEAQPGWLFAFVIAIGVGFSGFSLIELLGDQIKEAVKGAFNTLRTAFGGLLKGKNKDGSDE